MKTPPIDAICADLRPRRTRGRGELGAWAGIDTVRRHGSLRCGQASCGGASGRSGVEGREWVDCAKVSTSACEGASVPFVAANELTHARQREHDDKDEDEGDLARTLRSTHPTRRRRRDRARTGIRCEYSTTGVSVCLSVLLFHSFRFGRDARWLHIHPTPIQESSVRGNVRTNDRNDERGRSTAYRAGGGCDGGRQPTNERGWVALGDEPLETLAHASTRPG